MRCKSSLQAKGLIIGPAEISELNLADLSRLIAARELSSETVSAALTRLELAEDKLNAFITGFPSKRSQTQRKRIKKLLDDE